MKFQPGQKVWSTGNNFNKKPYTVLYEDTLLGQLTVQYENKTYTSRIELFYLAEESK